MKITHKNNGACIIITEWIDDNTDKLTAWEAQTRYNMDFFVERDKAARALKMIKEFLDINYISRDEYTEVESQKDKLLSLLPKNIQIEQGDLNLYYSLFRKELN